MLHDPLIEEKYEAKLGHFISQHQIAIGCAQQMVKAGMRYMYARAQALAVSPQRQEAEVEGLLKACGQPLDEQFAGRIGSSVENLSAVFRGDGNIRELVTHAWRFMNNVLCHDLVGKTWIPEALSIAKQANLNVEELEHMIWQARKFHRSCTRMDGLSPVSELDPREHFIKMPWHKVRQEQNIMRLKNPMLKGESIWSTVTKEEFEAEGGVLSTTEKRLLNGLGADYVPWLDARKVWLLDETHDFVKEAKQANIPLMTGISGFTVQIMQFARILNAGADVNARLVCLGYLLPIKAHSFHEVMAAAKAFGCTYSGNSDYGGIEPLSACEIISACGLLPSQQVHPKVAQIVLRRDKGNKEEQGK